MKTQAPRPKTKPKPKPKSKKGQRAEDKWSPQVLKFGYTALPNLLLRAQGKLKITPSQFTSSLSWLNIGGMRMNIPSPRRTESHSA